MGLFAPLKRRLGERALRREVQELRRCVDHLTVELGETRERLAAATSRARLLELEQETLLDIIERDRRRVQAETRSFAATIAGTERRPTDES